MDFEPFVFLAFSIKMETYICRGAVVYCVLYSTEEEEEWWWNRWRATDKERTNCTWDFRINICVSIMVMRMKMKMRRRRRKKMDLIEFGNWSNDTRTYTCGRERARERDVCVLCWGGAETSWLLRSMLQWWLWPSTSLLAVKRWAWLLRHSPRKWSPCSRPPFQSMDSICGHTYSKHKTDTSGRVRRRHQPVNPTNQWKWRRSSSSSSSSSRQQQHDA